jgi:UDP-2,3-diacylglucosamine hydrolase
MQPRAIFVSDIHLGSQDEPNAKKFLQLLDRLPHEGFTHLFLLGDIFDLWIADHTYFAKRFELILSKFRDLQAHGMEIHYFEGNHDLDLRPLFEKQLGIFVHEEAINIQFLGKKVRIEHGDQMDPDDRDYLFLRWLLRTRIVRFLGRHLPGPIVSRIGEAASHKSRKYTTGVRQAIGKESVEKKLIDHARRAYAEEPFELLVAGHVHVGFDETVQIDRHDVRIINLGTWLDQPLAFEIATTKSDLIPI